MDGTTGVRVILAIVDPLEDDELLAAFSPPPLPHAVKAKTSIQLQRDVAYLLNGYLVLFREGLAECMTFLLTNSWPSNGCLP